MPLPVTGYQLTADLVAAHGGGPVVCLAASAIGKTYQLYSSRPGVEFDRRVVLSTIHGDLGTAAASADVLRAEEEPAPVVTRILIRGPITQRAEPIGECGGYTEGHDTIAERLIAALEVGDVLLVLDTPGGAYSGGQQAIAAVLAAKSAHGRRITGWVDELCASMGFWWASCVCDEIFAPTAGAIGSIGARSAHGSVAGALAQAGIVPTFAAWPNDGKLAGVAELPLSDVGRERMQRGVDEAGEAFAAAVIASPYGMRHGLTRDAIVALSADCLSGEMAVARGLSDGVSTFREVQIYALTMASAGGLDMPGLKAGDEDPEKKDAVAAEEPDDDKEPKAEGDEPEPEGEEPSSACASCNSANEPNAKFCDQCGGSMAAKADDSDEPPPSSKREPGAAKPGAVAAPKAMSAHASLASILGATSESIPAIKTAAIRMRQVFDTVVGVTGQATSDRAIGALLSYPSRLATAAQVVADRKVEQAKAAKSERWTLCMRGIKSGAPEMARGKVVKDKVGEDGKREAVGLQPQFAEMKLGTLRGLVEGLEASATKRNPFEPDRATSKAVAGKSETLASFTAADKKSLQRHPSTLLLQRRGSALTAEKIVESLIASEPQSARAWLTQNGAAA